MNVPFHGAASSLKSLALALLRDACRERGVAAVGHEEAAGLLERLRKRPPDGEAILVEVARRFRLTDGELLAAALCLAAESDPRAARLVSSAQTPVGGSRPLAGFAATLFAEFGLDSVALLSGTGRRIGLFRFGDEDSPLTERSLQIPPAIVAALSGSRLEPEGIAMLAGPPTALPRSLLAEAKRKAAALADSRSASILVIRSPCAREGEAVAGAVAGALGLACADMGEQNPSDHSCWLAATASLPVLRRALGPGERSRIESPGA